MFVTLKWNANPTGRPKGFEERWDMSAQSELAEAWEKCGYCTIVRDVVQVQAVEEPEAHRVIRRRRKPKVESEE